MLFSIRPLLVTCLLLSHLCGTATAQNSPIRQTRSQDTASASAPSGAALTAFVMDNDVANGTMRVITEFNDYAQIRVSDKTKIISGVASIGQGRLSEGARLACYGVWNQAGDEFSAARIVVKGVLSSDQFDRKNSEACQKISSGEPRGKVGVTESIVRPAETTARPAEPVVRKSVPKPSNRQTQLYMIKFAVRMDSLSGNIKTFRYWFEKAHSNPSIVHNKDWQNSATIAIEDAIYGSRAIRSVSPVPPEARKLNATATQTSRELEAYFSNPGPILSRFTGKRNSPEERRKGERIIILLRTLKNEYVDLVRKTN